MTAGYLHKVLKTISLVLFLSLFMTCACLATDSAATTTRSSAQSTATAEPDEYQTSISHTVSTETSSTLTTTSGSYSTEKPTPEESNTEKSTTEESTTWEPTIDEYTTEESMTHETTTEKSTTWEPTREESKTKKSTTWEPKTGESTTHEIITEESTKWESTTEKSTTNESTTEESAKWESTTEEFTTHESTIEESTTWESTTEELTTLESTTEAESAGTGKPRVTRQPSAEIEKLLTSVSDPALKEITQVYLTNCPHASICGITQTAWEMLDDELTSCCKPCDCTAACRIGETCCPHLFPSMTVLLNLPPPRTECKVPGMFILWEDLHTRYTFIRQCQPGTDPTLQRQCETDIEKTDFYGHLPVTDRQQPVNYRNRHCAACNSVPQGRWLSWRPKVECGEYAYLNPASLTNERALVTAVKHSGECEILFVPPPDTVPKTCTDDIIHVCNVTGRWKSLDVHTAAACNGFSSVYRDTGRSQNMYRNVFCAICNGEEVETICRKIIFHPDGRQIVSFTALLDFSQHSDEGSPDINTHCDTGFSYDQSKEVCRQLECPPLTRLQSLECHSSVTSLSTIQPVLFRLAVRIAPIATLSMFQARGLVTQAAARLLSSLDKNVAALPCFQQLLYKTSLSSSANVTKASLLGATLVHGILQLVLYSRKQYREPAFSHTDRIPQLIQPDVFIQQILAVVETNISVTSKLQGDKFDFTVSLWRADMWYLDGIEEAIPNYANIITIQDPFDNLTIVSLSQPDKASVCLDDDTQEMQFTVDVLQQLDTSCPHFTLQAQEFTWVKLPTGIYISALNWTLSFGEYYSVNETEISVCYKDYIAEVEKLSSNQSTYSPPPATASGDNTGEAIASLACTGVSILCLIISLCVYCLLPDLQTLPGKNNMMLFFSLLTAQALYVVVGVGGVPRGWPCSVLGMALHFSWLLAIAWLGICSLHMLRVFIQIKSQASSTSNTVFVIYNFSAIVTSSLFVGLAVALSKLVYNSEDLGYGGHICYINRGKVILFTFGIPVAIVVISNIVMFLFVVIKIKSMPTVQKSVRNQRNNIIIFAKLSTLTGMTWLFQFVYQWTSITAFAYTFIILTASSGLFLMVSFVCNRRVHNLLRKKFAHDRSSLYASKDTPLSEVSRNVSQ